MPVKSFVHSSGKTFKFGRNRPTKPHMRSSFKDLIAADVLPKVNVPLETTYRHKAKKALHEVYMNNEWGCCTISGAAHVRGVTSANSRKEKIFTNEEIIQQYSAIGGFDPSQTQPDGSNPTDNGCDEVTAINYWEQTGYPDGLKITAAISVDATNFEECRLAAYLFENLYAGCELPDAWINNMPSDSGFVWDTGGAPDPNDGHCFIMHDILEKGMLICTWGMWGTITDTAMADYLTPAANGNLFVLLLPDVVGRLTEKTKAGYGTTDLELYLKQLGKPF